DDRHGAAGAPGAELLGEDAALARRDGRGVEPAGVDGDGVPAPDDVTPSLAVVVRQEPRAGGVKAGAGGLGGAARPLGGRRQGRSQDESRKGGREPETYRIHRLPRSTAR